MSDKYGGAARNRQQFRMRYEKVKFRNAETNCSKTVNEKRPKRKRKSKK